MKIVVCHTKGGTGKTTLAFNVGIALSQRGRDVWFIDADSQGSLTAAIGQRGNDRPALAAAHYSTGEMLLAQLKQSHRFDDVVIDAGGRDTGALRAALVAADLLLVPFPPRSLDLWALDALGTLVKEASEIRAMRGEPPLRVLGLLNQADAQGGDNAAAVDVARELGWLPMAITKVGRRKAFSNSTGEGLAVTELKPPDPKAIAELSSLVDELLN